MIEIEQIAAMIEDYELLPAQGTLVVAVSGGADSLCLLHLLNRLCGAGKRYPGVQLHVAHLNHQLRGSASERDALAMAQLAQDWQLPSTIQSIDVAALAAREHRSIEDAARTARYHFLREVAGGERIAVAHHQDDQAETLLLHWLRGGGLASTPGLQPRQGDIIRPLLNVTRADTHAYCAAHSLTPLEDVTNNDLHYQRNRIRHELLPLLEEMNPGFRKTLLRNAEVMSADLAWIEEQVDIHWSNVVQSEQPTDIKLRIPALLTLPLSLQRHLLRRASSHLCGGQSPLELRHYQLLEQLIHRSATLKTITLHLPHGLHCERTGDILLLTLIRDNQGGEENVPLSETILPLPGSIAVPGTSWIATAEWVPDEVIQQVRPALKRGDWATVWQILPTTPDTVYIDARVVMTIPQQSQPAFRVRTRRNGDRIQPLGMLREVRVKEVLINKHIPLRQRDQIPLFFSATHCIWLAGVHIDHRVRLTAKTSNIVCLSITQKHT
jgi:tRNA(Ile)-lysidine synthase